jgi:thioredoxin reductase (NADPH)
MPAKELYEVVILGSGPAGLTAALYTSRANLTPLVIERGGSSDPADVGGGQLMTTTDVDNYPGFPEGVTGEEIIDRMRKQALRFGTEIVDAIVNKVHLEARPFTLEFEGGGGVRAETLIIATGARARWLDLPRELEYRTKIGGVSACATCDGPLPLYRGKDLLVIGGGDTAMEEASFLTKFANKVTIVHRRDSLRASKIMQERARKNGKIEWLLETALEKYVGEDRLEGAVARNLKTGAMQEVKTEGIFMAIGHEPNTQLFRGVVETDENGYIKTQPGSTLTNIPGVFAAGDVQDHRYRQAITAAGTGCMAALDAERFLSHS